MPREKFELHEGSLWAIPTKFGFFQCVVTRVPEVRTQFATCYAYVHHGPRAEAKACADVQPLHEWGRCWHGFVTLRPFRTERWKRVGQAQSFERGAWPIPPSDTQGGWEPDDRKGMHAVTLYADDGTMRILACRAVDPGRWPELPVCQFAATASSFEKSLEDTITNRKPGFFDAESEFIPIDQERLSQWAKLKADVQQPGDEDPKVYTKPVEEGDLIAFPALCGGFGVGLARLVSKSRGAQEIALLTLDRWFESRPTERDLESLHASRILGFFRINSWECRYGTWTPLGKLPGYEESQWPLPPQLVYTEVEIQQKRRWSFLRRQSMWDDRPIRLGKFVKPSLPSDYALDAYPGPYAQAVKGEASRWNSYCSSGLVEIEHARWKTGTLLHPYQDVEERSYSFPVSSEAVKLWRDMARG